MGLLVMIVLAWVLFLAALSGLIAAVYPLVQRPLRRVHPKPRATLLRVLSTAPVVGGSLAVGLCLLPKQLGVWAPQFDHCLDHVGGHAHLCPQHPPNVEVGSVFGAGLGALAALALVSIIVGLRRLRNSWRSLAQLAGSSQFDSKSAIWIVESEFPVALSVGILRTRTILSTGLVRCVPSHLVDAIIAHEHAHEQRRDGLWRVLSDLLSFGHTPGTRGRLREDLELACEQACDELAGAKVGDRLRVAEALVAMARVRHAVPSPNVATMAFGSHGLGARVEALLCDSAGWNIGRRTGLAMLGLGTAIAIAIANPLHHFTETLIHHLLG